MRYMTDLAEEWLGTKKEIPRGVEIQKEEPFGVPVTRVTVKRAGLAKAPGVYITLLPPALDGPEPQEHTARILEEELKKLLLPAEKILVVGLGNSTVKADSLGPETLKKLLITRHLRDSPLLRGLSLREVSCFTPGVEASTGIETLELVKSVCKIIKPDKILCIDSLCAASVKSLGRTVQLSDAGLSPGKGKAFTSAMLGVPVIAMGIPTVARVSGRGTGMALTGQSIDMLIRRAASLLAQAVNSILYPGLSQKELDSLLS